MSEKIYCYCCRVHHPRELMQPFPTRHGVRWRCIATIEAAARSVCERDETGRRQTEANRAAASRRGDFGIAVRALLRTQERP